MDNLILCNVTCRLPKQFVFQILTNFLTNKVYQFLAVVYDGAFSPNISVRMA